MRKLMLATLLSLPMLASANLIQNGSFEASAQASNSWNIYAALPGWTAVPAVELRNNVSGAAQHGVNFVELDAYGNGTISQSFATVVGQAYELSFFYSNRTFTELWTNGLSFNLGGGTWLTTPTPESNQSGGNLWTQMTYGFNAQGSQTTLTFKATGTGDSYGTSLDNVSVVSAIPEPETYALMLAGLGAIGFVAFRRSRRT